MPEIENILVFSDFSRIILPPPNIAVTLHQILLKEPLQLTQTGETGKRKRAPQRLRNSELSISYAEVWARLGIVQASLNSALAATNVVN